MLRDIPIKLRFILSLLVSGLIPIMLVSLVGFHTARTELKKQAFRHLESVRNIKKIQIENYFNERITNIDVFSRNPHIIKAYKELRDSFLRAGGGKDAQFHGKRNGRFTAPRSYLAVHDRYFTFFSQLNEKYGFYDLFLITAKQGATLFTVRKESDFGIQIAGISSPLSDVWRDSSVEGKIALSDTKPYSPSLDAPAQFLSAPIRENGTIIGIIAAQISLDAIDGIMRERSGMWETGETYLVGPDFRMRSDSYMAPRTHSVQASFAGTIKANGVDTFSTRAAFTGKTGLTEIRNYRGETVLSAFSPVEIRGIQWAIIAEIDKREIDGRIARALNTRIVLLFFLSALVMVLLSWWISLSLNRGIKSATQQLENVIKDALKGNLHARGDTDSVNVDFRKVVHSANQLLDTFAGQWKEKRKLEEHIQFNQRLKAIGTLAGGIAHDFNNILTTLFSYSYIVMSELPEDSPAHASMNEIITSLRSASEMVAQILTLGRPNTTDKKIVEITEIVLSTCKLLKATLPQNIRLHGLVPKRKRHVRINPSQVGQILMNLSTNACHAMQEKGGDLTIELADFSHDGGEIPDLKQGEYCRLSVTDSGTGMDAAVKKRIFEPFFTTKSAQQGSGMGLSMVHGIVLNYGGRITVESEPGKGSHFSVFLPLIKPVEDTPAEAIPQPAATGSGEHILFIDDDPHLCQSGRKMLEYLGYRVTTLSDGRSVCRALEDNADAVDLVITDLNMPDVNGLDVARAVSARHPDIPVILMTGLHPDEPLYAKIKEETVSIAGILRKPFEKNQLARIIQGVFAAHRG